MGASLVMVVAEAMAAALQGRANHSCLRVLPSLLEQLSSGRLCSSALPIREK